jgi:hypothetical protein
MYSDHALEEEDRIVLFKSINIWIITQYSNTMLTQFRAYLF